MKDFVAIELLQRLLERYFLRRQDEADAFTSFLHNPELFQNYIFRDNSKSNIKKCGKKTFERL